MRRGDPCCVVAAFSNLNPPSLPLPLARHPVIPLPLAPAQLPHCPWPAPSLPFSLAAPLPLSPSPLSIPPLHQVHISQLGFGLTLRGDLAARPPRPLTPRCRAGWHRLECSQRGVSITPPHIPFSPLPCVTQLYVQVHAIGLHCCYLLLGSLCSGARMASKGRADPPSPAVVRPGPKGARHRAARLQAAVKVEQPEDRCGRQRGDWEGGGGGEICSMQLVSAPPNCPAAASSMRGRVLRRETPG